MKKIIRIALCSCVAVAACTPAPKVGHDQKYIDNGYRPNHYRDLDANHNDDCPHMNTQGHC